MSLLFSRNPLVVNPELAARIGLNEAILLQQLNYWLREPSSGIDHNGHRWVYNTLDGWRKQFPFMSESTIKRGFTSLKRMGIVRIEQLSQNKHDKTNYYSIIHESPYLSDEVNMTSSNRSDCTDGVGQIDKMDKVNLTQPIRSICTDVTETTTEITTETKTLSCPETSLPDEKLSRDEFLSRHPDAVVFSPSKRMWGSEADLTCAKWIWNRVLRLYEQAATFDGEIVRPKEPNWTAWANDVRLMCERDGRTHKQICELFKRVQNDPFWVRQVKCPEKLREKWDDLVIRIGFNPKAASDVNQICQPDSTIPPGFKG